jgi:DNA-binding NarL/FixJ family response regulator
MLLTTLSDLIRLRRRGHREDAGGQARSRSPRANPRDPASALSIPIGLAFQTHDGLAYTVRRVTPGDAGPLEEFLQGLSARTRWLRYMTARPCTPEVVHAEVARMLAGSAGSLITLVVAEAREGSEALIAVAELAYTRESGSGEVGVVVMDAAQRKGIGSLLLRQLVLIAQQLGLTHLHGDMLAENYAIQRLIKALGLSCTATIQSGEMHVIVRVPELEAAQHLLLTAREREILRLVAVGMTNPQIAAQLVIGAGTVKTHTLNIYRKLDVANRTQAIARAQELGLLRPAIEITAHGA